MASPDGPRDDPNDPYASRIEAATGTVTLDDVGHLSLPVDYAEEILAFFLGRDAG